MTLFLLFLSLLFANENTTDKSNLVKVEVLKSNNSHDNQPFFILFRLNIKKDWHTYWRNPGDSGMPTDIQIETKDNVKVSDIIWTEIPEKFPFDDLANFGFDKEENLIVKVDPKDIGKDINLKANIFWLVCKEECIPQDTIINITIPYSEKAEMNYENQAIIENLILHQPKSRDIKYSSSTLQDDNVVLESSDELFSKIDKFSFFPYTPGHFSNTIEPNVTKEGDLYKIKFQLDKYKIENPEKIEGLFVFEINGRKEAIEVNIPISK